MRDIKRKIMKDETHRDSNCVMITIICHGNRKGELLDKDMDGGWILEEFVADLSVGESLLNKPKIMLVQACRGRELCTVIVTTNKFKVHDVFMLDVFIGTIRKQCKRL